MIGPRPRGGLGGGSDARQARLGDRERGLDRLDHPGSAPPVEADASHLGQVVLRGRAVRGDLEQQVVAQHPVARQIARLGGTLAPGGERLDDREKARIARAQLDPLPGLLGLLAIGRGAGELGQLLRDPLAAPAAGELLRELLVDLAQVDHVVERVGQLLRAERPPRPVGEARALVDPRLGELGDQGLVADLLAIAADHRRELGVEQRRRDLAGQMMEDLDVLARGMEHLEHRRIGQQREQRRKIHAPARAGRPRRGAFSPASWIRHSFGK